MINYFPSGFHSDGRVYPAIELVDLYQMFCFLLDVDPLPNDGVWNRIRAMLRNGSAFTAPNAAFVGSVVAAVFAANSLHFS